MRARASGIAALEQRLGHTFSDPHLLETALTHASAVDPGGTTYQRLEFLGDRVLGLVVAEMLVDAFPNASEGELARRLTALVRNESCAAVARDLDLGSAVRLGSGEAQSGGRKKAAILGDVCEAVIGALHLDGGIEVARGFIKAHWRDRMISWSGPLRDAKTTLQEWAQGRGIGTPTYDIADRSGPDHAPRFVVAVQVGDLQPAEGTGGSRREAEQDAATAMLRREGASIGDRHR
ncbi:ribonuclease III [Bauldia sp.]|uniref:ribonuclease III n=1 Tax=Bauldia sp. TaxID=2575872 RepID=UPI003BA84C8B